MNLYPAIDLKGGQCVRLLRGAMDQATVYADDPAGQAARFQSAGCQWLHVVDLDGAIQGQPVNAPAVEAILAAVSVPVQLGGGIRDQAAVERWLGAGIGRVILGTLALRSPETVVALARAHPGRIAVGIDARNGKVAVEGWVEESETTALELAKRLEDAGVAALIYTDIDRDGALSGVNLEATRALAEAITIPVIASGGVASLEDIRRLKAEAPMLDGVISGRALYDGRLNLGDALAVLAC